jgi:hypothetical protein
VSEQTPLPGFEELVADDEGISREEARQISQDAREEFEQAIDDRPECAPLREPFLDLIEQGWDWRKALYIAWAQLPLAVRWPTTQEELAVLMGLRSSRTIRKWREKNPGIDLLVKRAMGARAARRVSELTANILSKTYQVGMSEDYKGHRDRRLWLEADGLLKQEMDINLTSAISSDEMAALQDKARQDVADFEAERFGEDSSADSG